MNRLVREFTAAILDSEGRSYVARVRGESHVNGQWDGWIEFIPTAGGPPLLTGRETTQSNYEQLDYWASGLSDTYLQMAFQRAVRAATAEVPPPLTELPYDVARIRAPRPEAPVVRVEVDTLDPLVPVRLMGATELFEGRVRRISGGGILVYDGESADVGQPTRHRFLLQYGSENAAAVLANRIWSDLHGSGATLRIEGELVEIDNHEMNERLKVLLRVFNAAA
jgi:hypothetical protein